jgi:hypothetical protein
MGTTELKPEKEIQGNYMGAWLIRPILLGGEFFARYYVPGWTTGYAEDVYERIGNNLWRFSARRVSYFCPHDGNQQEVRECEICRDRAPKPNDIELTWDEIE